MANGGNGREAVVDISGVQAWPAESSAIAIQYLQDLHL